MTWCLEYVSPCEPRVKERNHPKADQTVWLTTRGRAETDTFWMDVDAFYTLCSGIWCASVGTVVLWSDLRRSHLSWTLVNYGDVGSLLHISFLASTQARNKTREPLAGVCRPILTPEVLFTFEVLCCK